MQHFQERPGRELAGVTGSLIHDGELCKVLLPMVKALHRLSISWKVKSTPSVRSCFKTNTADNTATAIAGAVRPQVTKFLLSTEGFTASR